jgi:WD40 repeat protein
MMVDASDDWLMRALMAFFAVTFAPDGNTIAIAGFHEDDAEERGSIFLWDVSDADGISSTAFVDTDDDLIHSLQYSPDGRYFASGAANGTVRLWNGADNSCAIVMPGNGGAVLSVVFSPNGKLLASASAGTGDVRLWSVDDGDGSCLVNLSGHHAYGAVSLAFSPDGQTL